MAAAEWSSFQSKTHFGSLDGLRCLSILAVVWHHGPGIGLQGLAGRGYLGVPLFFAISGFLITTLLLRELDRTNTVSLRKFYMRRSLRIFPLYYAVLGLYCILVYLLARGTETAGKFYANLPYFVSYTSNWFVGTQGTFAFAWSLAAEEQFYATWPALLRYLKPGKAIWLAAAMVAATIASSLWIPQSLSSTSAPLIVLRSVPMAICWGCLAAMVLHTRRGFTFISRFLGNRLAFPALLALSAIVLATLRRPEVMIHFLFAALVVSSVVREDYVLAPLLRHPWVIHMGRISYGMYLLHGLVYDALGVAGNRLHFLPHSHSAGGFILATILTICVATLSFHFFEGYFLRLKTRFAA